MSAPYVLDTAAPAALALAPVLGFAFGFLLERGGLGNARKLAGQFYCTDFTVFRVLFSAVITAMLGAYWLSAIGVLDLSQVYVPETWVLPQLLGGAVFGIGFVLGGLCPGTSCVAGATGRMDGLAVMGGMLGGVLLFNATFRLLADTYDATPMGTLTLDRVLRLPYGVTVAVVTLVGIAMFAIAARLERQ